MPDNTVRTTSPGVQNPYGNYTALYRAHRMSEMYANAANDYSVKGGSKKKAATKQTPKKGY